MLDLMPHGQSLRLDFLGRAVWVAPSALTRIQGLDSMVKRELRYGMNDLAKQDQ